MGINKVPVRLMVFDRDIIKKSFSRAASTYDEFALFQKDVANEVGERLLCLLGERAHAFAAPAGDAKEPTSFLDIGCGTGRLAEVVSSQAPGVRACASDISSAMLCMARQAHGDSIDLVGADFSFLPFRDSSFDSIGSSLAFQWADDLESALREAARVLKPGGFMVFSTLGPATLKELRECYKGYHGLEFMEKASVEAAIKSAHLEPVFVEDRLVIRRYGSFIELLKALKNIGAAPPVRSGKGLSPGRALKEAGRLYSELHPSGEGGVEATYELILAAARKV